MRFTYTDIFGWFDFEDIYLEAVATAQDGAVFVEVGCCLGRSTAFMAAAIRDTGKRITFHAVDPWVWSPNDKPSYGQFVANMRKAGVTAFVQAHRALSVPTAADFDDASLDFVFIDAQHTYEEVSADIRAWLPKVRPGGVLAGHDFHAQFPGVLQAVQENLPQAAVQTRGSSFWYQLPQVGL